MRIQLALPVSFFISILLVGMTWAQTNSRLIDISRNNCARIKAASINSTGTGFFLDATHVITCFHVIAAIQVIDASKGQVQWTISNNISVKLNDGETIDATCVSIPTQEDPSPLLNDFAILKLAKKPKSAPSGLSIYKGKESPDVGSDIVFSGFPLGAPAMITHKGYISGVTDDKSIICIQAPINKGNSGGAVLNLKGEILGIISNREGGISQGLEDVTKQITDLEEGRSGVKVRISMGGVNTFGVTKELITTLDKYISTGIGYARSVKALQSYIEKNPDSLK